jgi:hypothetical protein
VAAQDEIAEIQVENAGICEGSRIKGLAQGQWKSRKFKMENAEIAQPCGPRDQAKGEEIRGSQVENAEITEIPR